MRIVGGRFKGRPLTPPTSDAVRPTSDRLRETIFNILVHAYDDAVRGARVLDLFAGTGALGLEALSRGAVYALFVDDGSARGVVERNVRAFDLGKTARLLRRDATRMGPAAPDAPFDLVFCDPPYGRGLAPPALASCAQGGWLVADALVVVEETAGAAFAWPAGFVGLERRAQGDTQLIVGRFTP